MLSFEACRIPLFPYWKTDHIDNITTLVLVAIPQSEGKVMSEGRVMECG